ncbi:MAG: hypothetical protein V4637_10975 [Pseudomonadota bacterium]
MTRVSLALAVVALLTACAMPMDHSKMNASDHGAMAGCSMGSRAGEHHNAGMAAMTGKPDSTSMMMCGKPGSGAEGGCMMAQGATGEKSMGCCCGMMKHKS